MVRPNLSKSTWTRGCGFIRASGASATKKIKEERVRVEASTKEIKDRNLSGRLALAGL